MLALCESIFGKRIPSSKRYLGELDETCYAPLVVGEIYSVYALLFIYDRVDFLVGEYGQPPFWVPSDLFILNDSGVPEGWGCCITQTDAEFKTLFEVFGIHFILGYTLLISDYQHYVGLVERDVNELQRFFEINVNESHV